MPHAIIPTIPTQGHFVLSPVSLASRDQDDGPVELNDRHLRSHGKIGDCEQSNENLTYHLAHHQSPSLSLSGIERIARLWVRCTSTVTYYFFLMI